MWKTIKKFLNKKEENNILEINVYEEIGAVDVFGEQSEISNNKVDNINLDNEELEYFE